jgi:hypothetical protein
MGTYDLTLGKPMQCRLGVRVHLIFPRARPPITKLNDC